MLNPRIKYKSDKRKKEIYDSIENKYGKVDENKLNKIRLWIKTNIFDLVESVKKIKII